MGRILLCLLMLCFFSCIRSLADSTAEPSRTTSGNQAKTKPDSIVYMATVNEALDNSLVAILKQHKAGIPHPAVGTAIASANWEVDSQRKMKIRLQWMGSLDLTKNEQFRKCVEETADSLSGQEVLAFPESMKNTQGYVSTHVFNEGLLLSKMQSEK